MVQDLSLEQDDRDLDLQKQKSFSPRETCTVPSRVKAFHNFYCIGAFKKSAININKDALVEYEHLK